MAAGIKVLVVGGGGREHALAWKCAQSPRVAEVLVAPGNAGTAREPKVRNVPVGAEQLEQLADLAQREGVALTIVGPEAPLVAGITDLFTARGLACFGPSRAAAQLEGSKAFTKAFLQRHGIPTAGYRRFTRADFDRDWLAAQRAPIVVKASGLAAGKGVIIAQTPAEAVEAAESMLAGRFGSAGEEIVIEEFLEGEEASFIVLCDGQHALPMASSQDHKRLRDGDAGPNTGGMGAYSPVPSLSDALVDQIMETAIRPVVEELQPYQGVLFAGLMLTEDGPKVLEYNCRFGDPETQALVPLLSGSLAEVLLAAATGDVTEVRPRLAEGSAVTVVLASRGYPGSYPTGVPIEGVADAEALDGVTVFHAGTTRDDNDRLVTAGGRVLAVTGTGATLAHARERAYAGVARIHFDGMHHRTDIAAAAAQEERS
jgi:phosphoribosylamine--glycine ligase